MDNRLKRAPGIFLVGFMGSGKTTVGRLLAERLGWPFADVDDDIEARERTTITEIFAARGEEEFRRVETEAIRERVRAVCTGMPMVVALGGGAFARPENRALLRDHGITVWLDCALETLQARVAGAEHRPLARDPARFAELYGERAESYARADFRVDAAAGDPEAVVEQILRLPALQ
ncbi:MAG: shikimate kinase [Bryobacteraceae bacterium]